MKTSLVLLNLLAAIGIFFLAAALHFVDVKTIGQRLSVMRKQGVINTNTVTAFLDSQGVGADSKSDTVRLRTYLWDSDSMSWLGIVAAVAFLANAVLIGIFWKKLSVQPLGLQPGVQPESAANRSQPVSSGTNRTSAAAGSGG